MSTNQKNLKFIKDLNYIPVGLKNNDFSSEWLRDNTGQNISKKINIMESILFIFGIGKIY